MAHAALEYVIRLAESLTPEDKQALVGHLIQRLDQNGGLGVLEQPVSTKGEPISLRGVWRAKFPPDLDVDAILREIRGEWEGELPEVVSP